MSMYEAYFDDVYRYVLYKTGSKWDTDDLVSEVFHKAYRSYSSAKQPENAKAWVMTIARHTVIDHYRKRKETVSADILESFAQDFSVEEKVEHAVEVDCLHKALAYLPDEDREVMTLRYFAEMKHREIGAVLGKQEDTVKTRVSRLLRKLGGLVKGCLEGKNAHG